MSNPPAAAPSPPLQGRKDVLGLALVTLAKEVWVIRDRQIVTEALLAEKGLLQELDTYQPSPELAEKLAAERDRFVRGITTILLTGAPGET